MNRIGSDNKNGKRVLFGCVPADGHFNPLTGLAKHLQSIGYDVRWYTQDYYKEKLKKLEIPFYPFVNGPQLNQDNFESFFTERANIKGQAAKFRFDLEHCFIKPAVEITKDIENIHKEFPFDILIVDVFCFCTPMVKAKLGVPVIAVGVTPFMQTSKDLPPAGLGLMPSAGFIGKMKKTFLHWVTDNVIFKRPNKLFRRILEEHGYQAGNGNVFDILYNAADVVLQSGTPGFEYQRSDLKSTIHFAGPLLPYSTSKASSHWFDERLNTYDRVVLLTQGTVEKDINKILVPALEAFQHTRTLVVCTTGGSGTNVLRKKYTADNIIIEDFIPFGDVMPYADAYITNGGYGGVMLAIENGLPLVVAGIHEGKNEICARIGYFNYGINLKTETPLPNQLRSAVEEVICNRFYRQNVEKLRKEFGQYNPNELCARYVKELVQPGFISKRKAQLLSESIY